MNLMNLSAILSLDKRGFDRGLGDAEKMMKNTGKMILGAAAAITAAIGGAGATFISQLRQVSEIGDAIDKNSQKLGISRRNYQMWGYILERSGADISVMTAGMKTLNKAISGGGKDSEKALNKLGLSAKQLSKLSQEDAFAQVVAAFQQMPEGAEKSALAVQLFGRGGMELLPVLNMTTSEMDALSARAVELGVVLGDEAVDACANFDDAMTDMRVVMSSMRNKEFAKFLPAATRVVNGIVDVLLGKDGIGKIESGLNEIASRLATELPSIIQRGGKIFRAITNGLGTIAKKLWPTISKGISKMLKGLPQTLVNVLRDVGNGIIDIINGVFGINIPHIKEIKLPTWDEIKVKATAAINRIIRKINSIFGTNIPEITELKLPSWEEIKTKATEHINTLIDKINGLLGLNIPHIEEFRLPTWEEIQGTVIKAVNSIIDGINGLLGLNIPHLEDIGMPDLKTVIASVQTWWNENGIGQFISNTCSWILSIFKSPQEALTPEKVMSILGQWWTTGRNVIAQACTWVLGLFRKPEAGATEVKSEVSKWWMRAKGWVIAACTWTLGLFGIDISAESVSEAVGGWWSTVKQKAEEAIDWTLSMFGFPSKEEIEGTGLGLLSDLLTGIQGVLDWLGRTFLPLDDFETFAQTIGSILAGVVVAGAVDKAIALFQSLSTFTMPNLTVGGWIGAIATILALIVNNWDEIQGGLELVGEWFSENFAPIIQTFNDIADAISGAVHWMKVFLGLESEDPVSTGSGTGNDVEGWLDWTRNEYAANERIGFIAAESGRDIGEVRQEVAQRLAEAQSWVERQGILQEYEIPINFDAAIAAEQQLQNTEKEVEALDGKEATIGVNIIYRTRGGKTQAYTVGEDGTLTPFQQAKGLDYVPYDNYVSRLHRGEAVLSGNEARAWRESGGRGQNYDGSSAVVSAIHGLSSDIQNMRLYVGERAFAGAVVDYSGRQMHSYLGGSDTRRRKGYGRK